MSISAADMNYLRWAKRNCHCMSLSLRNAIEVILEEV